MIAAHDSFTFLKSEDFFSELFSMFWRCQNRSINDLYNNGVKFFDIRITRNMKHGYINKFILHKEDKPTWTIAHGVAEMRDKALYSLMSTKFDHIEDICSYFDKVYPKAKYRILLEKDSKRYKELFKEQITGLEEKHPNLLWYGIKHPWEELYKSPKYPEIEVDYICHPFNWNRDISFKENLKNFKFEFNIKKWAKKYNPEITQKMIRETKTLYWMDYIPVIEKEQ